MYSEPNEDGISAENAAEPKISECVIAVNISAHLLLELCHVDISLGISTDGHNLHSSHDCAGGVCAVGTDWDDADVSVSITPEKPVEGQWPHRWFEM
jgi:hypothetical protein